MVARRGSAVFVRGRPLENLNAMARPRLRYSVSKTRFLMYFSLRRIELTRAACEAAPQPPIPEHSIFQSFSVLLAGLAFVSAP